MIETEKAWQVFRVWLIDFWEKGDQNYKQLVKNDQNLWKYGLSHVFKTTIYVPICFFKKLLAILMKDMVKNSPG